MWSVVAIAAIVLVGCCCNSCSKSEKKHHKQSSCPAANCPEQTMETVTVEAVEIIPVAPADSTAGKKQTTEQNSGKNAVSRHGAAEKKAPAAPEKNNSAM